MRNLSNALRAAEIGIDLGTANTLVVAAEVGVVFDQPSVCCFQAYDAVPRFVAAGREASSYVGKVARPLKIVRPLRDGVLSDIVATRELLHFVQKSIGSRRGLRRVRPWIGVPADATQSERRALATAAIDAGFAQPELIPEPLLAAIGLGLNVHAARGRMVVDCGAGTTEVALISLGRICLSKSVRGGGEALNRCLSDHLNSEHRFRVGVVAAETLKLHVSDALASGDTERLVVVSGLDTASGLPRRLTLPTSELLPVWLRHIEQIVSEVRFAFRETPPELSQDVLEDGVTLTGGGALSALLAERIGASTGIQTRVADAPKRCVALGLQKLLEHAGDPQALAA